MPRPPKGIYVDGDAVRFFGYRKVADPPGLDWHDGLRAAARSLLESPGETPDLRFLRWDGTTVRAWARADRDAIAAADVVTADDAWIDGERQAALVEALVSTTNAATGSTITAAEVRAAYIRVLGR